MNPASEKRVTQIDFSRLEFHPPLESSVRRETAKGLMEEEDNTGSHTGAKNGSEKTGKRSLSPGGKLQTHTRLKHLRLPEIVQSGTRAYEYLKTTHASPWETYEKSYDIRLGADDSFVTVAERRDTRSSTLKRNDPFSELALVKCFSGPNEDKLRRLQQIQNASIVLPLEAFRVDEACYVVFEYMAYSLHYVTGNSRIDEIRLAAIVGQVRTPGTDTINEFIDCSRYSLDLRISHRKGWNMVR